MPPGSRTPFDGEDAPAEAAKEPVDFTYAVPGPRAVDAHYHVRFLEDGTVRVEGAGKDRESLPEARFLRAPDPVAVAAALRSLMVENTDPLDPVSKSACDSGGHEIEGRRRPPTVRVLGIDWCLRARLFSHTVEENLQGHEWRWLDPDYLRNAEGLVDLHIVGE